MDISVAVEPRGDPRPFLRWKPYLDRGFVFQDQQAIEFLDARHLEQEDLCSARWRSTLRISWENRLVCFKGDSAATAKPFRWRRFAHRCRSSVHFSSGKNLHQHRCVHQGQYYLQHGFYATTLHVAQFSVVTTSLAISVRCVTSRVQSHFLLVNWSLPPFPLVKAYPWWNHYLCWLKSPFLHVFAVNFREGMGQPSGAHLSRGVPHVSGPDFRTARRHVVRRPLVEDQKAKGRNAKSTWRGCSLGHGVWLALRGGMVNDWPIMFN